MAVSLCNDKLVYRWKANKKINNALKKWVNAKCVTSAKLKRFTAFNKKHISKNWFSRQPRVLTKSARFRVLEASDPMMWL